MTGAGGAEAFVGFAVIGGLVLVGIAGRLLGIITPEGARALDRVAFGIATPALIITVLARSEPGRMLEPTPLLLLASALLAFLLLLGLLALVLRHARPAERAALGAAGVWVNASNIGLPIATYLLGDPTAVIPVLLVQLLVFSPLLLLVFDLDRSRHEREGTAGTDAEPAQTTARSPRRALLAALLNPVTLASSVGLLLALSGLGLPAAVASPLELLADAALPLMLLAFGAALLDSPGPAPTVPGLRSAVLSTVAMKSVGMPALALGLGVAVGLDRAALVTLVVLAALPTGQNVATFAARYGVLAPAVRVVLLVTTVLASPIILTIVWLG